VLAVECDRRALQAIALGRLKPQLARFLNRDALAISGVRPTADLNLRVGRPSVGFLFAVEGTDVPLAVLVGVIANPRLFLLALARGPCSFAN
jgi:hypothetical protein